MQRNNNAKNTNIKFVSALLIGVLVSVITSIVLTLVTAFGISKEIIQENSMNRGISVIQILSIFGGCIFGISQFKKKKLIIGVAISAGYILILLITGLTAFEKSINNPIQIILSMSLGLGAAIGMHLFKTPKKKYIKKRLL